MDLTWIKSLLFAGRKMVAERRDKPMLDAIFMVLGIVIFAGACGYAALCERM